MRKKLNLLYKTKNQIEDVDRSFVEKVIESVQYSQKGIVDKILALAEQSEGKDDFLEKIVENLTDQELDSQEMYTLEKIFFRNIGDEIIHERENIYYEIFLKRSQKNTDINQKILSTRKQQEILEKKFEEEKKVITIDNYLQGDQSRLGDFAKTYIENQEKIEDLENKKIHNNNRINEIQVIIDSKKEKEDSREEFLQKIEKQEMLRDFFKGKGIGYHKSPYFLYSAFYQNPKLLREYRNFLYKEITHVSQKVTIEEYLDQLEEVSNDQIQTYVNKFIYYLGHTSKYYEAIQFIEGLEVISTCNFHFYEMFLLEFKKAIKKDIKIIDSILSGKKIYLIENEPLYDFLIKNIRELYKDEMKNIYLLPEYESFLTQLNDMTQWKPISSTNEAINGKGSGHSLALARSIFKNIENILQEQEIKDLITLFGSTNCGVLMDFHRDINLDGEKSHVKNSLSKKSYENFSNFILELSDAITDNSFRSKRLKGDEDYAKEFQNLMKEYAKDIKPYYKDLEKKVAFILKKYIHIFRLDT